MWAGPVASFQARSLKRWASSFPLGLVRLQPQQRLAVGERLVEPVQAGLREAPGSQQVGIVRAGLQRRGEVGDGLLEPAQAGQRVAALVVGLGVVGVGLDGAGHPLHDLLGRLGSLLQPRIELAAIDAERLGDRGEGAGAGRGLERRRRVPVEPQFAQPAADRPQVPDAEVGPIGERGDHVGAVRRERHRVDSRLLRVLEPRQLAAGLDLGQDQGPGIVVVDGRARVGAKASTQVTPRKRCTWGVHVVVSKRVQPS